MKSLPDGKKERDGMKITKRQDGDILTIAVEGRLDTNTAPAFGSEVEGMIRGATKLVFDFDRLEYISSAGLRMLLMAQKEMNKRGEMKIINVSEAIYEVLEDIGFTGVSDIAMKG